MTAVGTGSFTYQWYHNNVIVSGAVTNSLLVSNATRAQAGSYFVVVTDSTGLRRSAPIFVIVTAAITEVRAWGSNAYGELTMPAGLNDAVLLGVGEVHMLAVKRNGSVVAWGQNSSSGEGTIPADWNDVVAVAAGTSHSLALKSDGTVASIGWYSSGYHPPPAGLDNVVAIAAGEFHSAALKSDGTVVLWGGDDTVPAGLSGCRGHRGRFRVHAGAEVRRNGGRLGERLRRLCAPAGWINQCDWNQREISSRGRAEERWHGDFMGL